MFLLEENIIKKKQVYKNVIKFNIGNNEKYKITRTILFRFLKK